ncbi:MAG: YfhO family protein [Chloroflexota bacterium]|nr:YfhO family protein [Chloroflexota bacterium]
MNTKRSRPEGERAADRLLLALRSWDPESVVYQASFAVFALALLWRALFAGEAFFWGTPLLQFVPWQQLAANMWRSGHLPLWNPLVGCGAPLAANYQTAAFYPMNALHLLMRAEVALSWTVALHLALAGWGMYRWGRSVGLDRFPAFVGGLALEGSGFVVARAALFPSIALTFPWLGIWLWRAEALVQTARLRDAAWLGLTLGLGLLAGHAQTAFYGGLLLGAYVLFRTLQEARSKLQIADCGLQVEGCRLKVAGWTSRVAGLMLVSLALGVALAAVQLVPTGELLMVSQRASGVDDGLGMTYSLWPWRLITLAAPDFFGNPGRGTYWGYATYWEDAGYVGVLPLVLAVWAVTAAVRGTWRRPETERIEGGRLKVDGCGLTVFSGCAALASLILALGKHTPVYPFLFEHVPGFGLFQAPARWLAVTTVALAALAGMGAQCWPRGDSGRRLGGLVATVGGALLIAGLVAPKLLPGIPATFGPATARLGVMLVVAGGLTLLREGHSGAWEWGSEGDEAWWRAAVGAFIALDLLTFGWPLVPTVDRAVYGGETDSAAVLESEGQHVRVYWPTDPNHDDQHRNAEYRVKFDYLRFDDFGPNDAAYWRGLREVQLPNAGMLDGVASANNFEPLLVGRYAELMEAAVEAPGLVRAMGATHVASDRPWPDGERVHSRGPVSFYRLPNAPGRAWIVPRVRRVAAGDMVSALAHPTFNPTAEVVVELDAPVGSPSEGTVDSWRILSLREGPNEVTIRASLDAPGTLVLADTWYPGWRVKVDGEPAGLLRANHAFRAVQLEAGEHLVEMVYRPTSVVVGAATSLIALAILTLGIARGRREGSSEERLDSGKTLKVLSSKLDSTADRERNTRESQVELHVW